MAREISFPKTFITLVPSLGRKIMGSSGEEFPLYSEVANSLCCTFFFNWHWLS